MNEFRIQTAQQLASHLRSLRIAAGLTQAQLGERLGVEQARVAKIERNPGSVRVDQMLEVLHALGAMAFLRRRPQKPSTPSTSSLRW